MLYIGAQKYEAVGAIDDERGRFVVDLKFVVRFLGNIQQRLRSVSLQLCKQDLAQLDLSYAQPPGDNDESISIVLAEKQKLRRCCCRCSVGW